MGRRREPRHPLGAGEREDRERQKREARKTKRLTGKRSEKDVAGRVDSEPELDIIEPIPVDTEAEAGGMGLLLVPLTPDDMRSNYPEVYVERCGEYASKIAGAVEEAKTAEADSDNSQDLKGENIEGKGMSQRLDRDGSGLKEKSRKKWGRKAPEDG